MPALSLLLPLLALGLARAEKPLPPLARDHLLSCLQCYQAVDKALTAAQDPALSLLESTRALCSRRYQELALGDEVAQSDLMNCVRLTEAVFNGSVPSLAPSALPHCRRCYEENARYVLTYVNASYEPIHLSDPLAENRPLFRPREERTTLFSLFYDDTYNLILMVVCAFVTSVLMLLMCASLGIIRLQCGKKPEGKGGKPAAPQEPARAEAEATDAKPADVVREEPAGKPAAGKKRAA